MTKMKFVIIAEEDGIEAQRTQPEFLFGFEETLTTDQLEELLFATVLEMTGILQQGLRVQAKARKMKIWPEEG